MRQSSLLIAMLLMMACNSTRHLNSNSTKSDTTIIKGSATATIDTNIIEPGIDFGMEVSIGDSIILSAKDSTIYWGTSELHKPFDSISIGVGCNTVSTNWAQLFMRQLYLKDTTICNKGTCLTAGVKNGVLHAYVSKPDDTLHINKTGHYEYGNMVITKTIHTTTIATVKDWKVSVIVVIAGLIIAAISTYVAKEKKTPDDTDQST